MTNKMYIYFTFLLYFTALVVNAYQDDGFLDGQITLIVEDSLEDSEDPVFTQRSMIYIRSIKSGMASITHTREWTDNLINQLKTLSDNDGLYRIKIYPEHDSENAVSTFTKACLMYESQLSEAFSLMVDASSTSLIGASIFTRESVCQGYGMSLIPSTFNTTVLTRSYVVAPIPDTATYIQKLEAKKMEKAEGKEETFLGKYWMYLVPLVVLFIISSGGQESGGRSS